MLEIEQKYARADFPALQARLAEWGAKGPQVHGEADHYFNAPDRDFARTGEAFRLRRVGSASRLTYKGPRQAAAVKTRLEIEVPLADGDETAADMARLLTSLGYRPVAVVRKRRREYRLARGGFDLTVCLDEVDELGRFAEVEIVAPEERKGEAQAVLAETAAALGLDPAAVERRSYLTMLLAARGA